MLLRIISLLISLLLFCNYGFVLANQESVFYDVYFNDVLVGKIEYSYVGKNFTYENWVEVLLVKTNINVAPLFNLKSHEYIYLDSKTYLPLKVERKINFFGKREVIKEIYNQKKGYVKIYTNGFAKKTKIFYPGKPIQNMLALLYYFPKNLDLDKKSFFSFIFPTNKIDLKVDSLKTLMKNGKTKNVYLIKGLKEKHINVFLEKETKTVLHLSVNLPVGKVLLARKDY
ncbi:MAG: hypothetical protein NC935_00365 [Candidatus Omnitrophica bacterium]|nr:hypothetical protein [Candidatus Omnitrophota bacterium]